ncbi:hypothetical protein COU75_02500 [Candidatus Peregrinibacteria bacterium CG10_big_fil_rev_8_21_14_0_10_42_8]|nr:MAG: hypothetical protein COU75_02500 [Candidatus Peregrinibacteria bacterium CG10_big_fil_rev_8_21_14_0_10_42_8]
MTMSIAQSTSRTRMIGLLSLSALFVTILHSVVAGLPTHTASAVFTECADGIDNDHDGLTDYPQDPQCLSLHDDSEGPTGRGLFVSLSDGLTTVAPNGHMTYTVSLRTEREEGMVVDVYFQMPHQTNLLSISDGGSRSEEIIVWKNVSVYPGKLRPLYVNVNVTPHAEENLLLVAEAVAEGEKSTDTTRVELDEASRTRELLQMKVSVTDGMKYAQPGEVLNYVVAVRNPTNDERTVDVRLQIPTDTEVEYVSGDYTSNRQAIVWSNQVIGPQGVREYKVSVRIDSNAQEFYMIRTHASVGAAKATDTTSVHTGVLPTSILVSTTDGLDQIVPGALVTYDIAVDNISNQLATEVDVNNALPQHLEFVDASEGGYWTGKNVRWEGLTVAPNGNRTLRVTGRVRSDAPLGERLRNTVSVKDFEAVDYTHVGNTIAGAGLAQQKSVLISKHADRNEVQPGDTVMYTVSLQNTTGRTLYNVLIEDRMDSDHVRILNASSGTTDGNSVSWVIPELGAGEDWSTVYNAQIDYRAPHGVVIPNVVTVSGDGMETISLTERISTSHINVISNLPPTGAAFDALFLALTGLLGAGQTLAQRRRLV